MTRTLDSEEKLKRGKELFPSTMHRPKKKQKEMIHLLSMHKARYFYIQRKKMNFEMIL